MEISVKIDFKKKANQILDHFAVIIKEQRMDPDDNYVCMLIDSHRGQLAALSSLLRDVKEQLTEDQFQEMDEYLEESISKVLDLFGDAVTASQDRATQMVADVERQLRSELTPRKCQLLSQGEVDSLLKRA